MTGGGLLADSVWCDFMTTGWSNISPHFSKGHTHPYSGYSPQFVRSHQSYPLIIIIINNNNKNNNTTNRNDNFI